MSEEKCMVCEKHADFGRFTGEPIAERSGLVLTHFPQIDGEKAYPGHLLIETRRHITDLAQLNADEGRVLGGLISDGEKILKKYLQAEHVYLFRINDKVAHLHFHLIPRYADTPREFWGWKITEWPGAQRLALTAIKVLSTELKFELSRQSSSEAD